MMTIISPSNKTHLRRQTHLLSYFCRYSNESVALAMNILAKLLICQRAGVSDKPKL